MRAQVRWHYLLRTPQLLGQILLGGRYDFTYDLMPMRSQHMPMRKRLNLAATGLNLLHRRLKPWAWPIHIQMELTSFCNLHCPVCPTGLGKLTRPPQAMDVSFFSDVMDQVGPYLLTTSLWAWGEPLLHPQFADAVAICRKHGVLPLFSTNGQNLEDDRVTDDLLREPPYYLIAALDGLTDETNSQYRRGARLEGALHGIRRLARLKRERGQELPVLLMRFIVMKHNEHELPRVREFAVENGFDMLTIRALGLRDVGEPAHKQFVPDSEAYRAYAYRGGERVRREDYICQLAFCFPTMLADGTLVACDQDFNGTAAFGQVGRDGSFADVWFGDRAARVRREIRESLDAFSFCRICPFADRLTSECSVEAFDLRDGGKRTAMGPAPVAS
jgi:MoaA/NifB/PqqE/SkfB family radical SAM enzyme